MAVLPTSWPIPPSEYVPGQFNLLPLINSIVATIQQTSITPNLDHQNLVVPPNPYLAIVATNDQF
jgi:hypothetical protein